MLSTLPLFSVTVGSDPVHVIGSRVMHPTLLLLVIIGQQGEPVRADMAVCEGPSNFKLLYDLSLPIEEKINIISKEIFRADGIQLSELAQVDTYTQ